MARVCDISGVKDVHDRVVIVNVPLDFRGEVVLREFGLDGTSLAVLESAVELHDFELSKEAMQAFERKDWSKLNELTPRSERAASTSRRSEGAKKAAQTRRENKERAEREQAEVEEAARHTRAVVDSPQA